MSKEKSENAELEPCPVCGSRVFHRRGCFDDCPVCGWEDAWIWKAEEEPDEILPTNWVSLNEAKWLWNKYHEKVNECAQRFKSKPLDRIRMED